MKTAGAMGTRGAPLRTPAPGDSLLAGRAGGAAERCLEARAYSDWARGPMLREAEDAFASGWDDRNHGWQGEYWGKTMLCFAGAAAYTRDPALKAWVAGRARAFVRERQRPNGYLCTYSDESFLKEGFSVWERKYTLWALIEIHRATGDAECLAAAERLLGNLVAGLEASGLAVHETGIWHGVSSMSVLKPALELWELTGNPDYRAFADRIVAALENPALKEAALLANAARPEPIAEWFPEAAYWAKAYEIMSCLEGCVHYARASGERRVLEEVLAFHAHLEREELNPMRSAGFFDHFLSARDHLNGMTELCDVTHWIRLNRELLLATGEARFADRVEEAFLNAFLAGVSRDGRWGAHIVRSHGTRHLWAPPQTGMFHHQCCPDNMMRTFFDLAGTVAAEGPDGALSVILYGDARARLGAGEVEVSGGYPYSDAPVRVRVTRPAAGKVRFRIPAWSPVFRLNGEERAAEAGWFEVDAPAGESVWTLAFDLSPRVLPSPRRWGKPLPPSPQPHSLEPGGYTVHFMEWLTPDMAGLSRVEPALAVMRGPLVLAKGRAAGTARGETFAAFPYENGGEGWAASLAPAPAAAPRTGAGRVWNLTLSRGVECRTLPVSDFASVSDIDDPDNWFSLWF